MSKHVVVPRDEVKRLLTPAYKLLGFRENEVLEHCLEMGNDGWANGVSTHGHNVILINHGAFGVDCGLIDPVAEQHQVAWERPSIQHWNGNQVAGPALGRRAVDAAIEMAKNTGIGNIQVSNTGHVGCPGVLAKKIAEAGYVGRVITRGGRVECMAPGGQKSPRASTDTVSWGLPTADFLGFSLVLDFTLAQIAMGKVRKAVIGLKECLATPNSNENLCRKKFALPSGIAYDEDGYETTDPRHVFPNGGVSYIGDTKGFGLAACNEVLGSFFGFKAPSVVSEFQVSARKEAGDANARANSFEDVRSVSFEIEVMEVPRTPERDEEVRDFVNYVFGGSDTLRIPGERRHQFFRLCEEHNGLLLSDDIVGWLLKPPFAEVINFNPSNYQTVEL